MSSPAYVEFYRITEWLKAQPQPIRMTIGQLTEAVTSAMGKPIKMATVRRAVKVTEIEIVDPRAINFQGRDRAKRLATLINLILTDLEVQFGYKPTQTITDELLTLTRGQGTTLDVE